MGADPSFEADFAAPAETATAQATFMPELRQTKPHGFQSGEMPLPQNAWMISRSKRCFDLVVVLATLPLTVPLLLSIALWVGISSSGPVLFRQLRVGRDGSFFWILKFRTMHVGSTPAEGILTAACDQRLTAAGRFLRRWKLDELPQLWNVLCGEMSLVGPRPKVLAHCSTGLSCRPGMTGAASLVFAGQEALLQRIPQPHLEAYYRQVVAPVQQTLDEKYAVQASLWSDLALLVKTIFFIGRGKPLNAGFGVRRMLVRAEKRYAAVCKRGATAV